MTKYRSTVLLSRYNVHRRSKNLQHFLQKGKKNRVSESNTRVYLKFRMSNWRARNLQIHVECTISRGTLKPLLRQLKTRATGITTGEGRRISRWKLQGKFPLPLRLRPRNLIEKRWTVSFPRSTRDSRSNRWLTTVSHGFPLKLISTTNISIRFSKFNSFIGHNYPIFFFIRNRQQLWLIRVQILNSPKPIGKDFISIHSISSKFHKWNNHSSPRKIH